MSTPRIITAGAAAAVADGTNAYTQSTTGPDYDLVFEAENYATISSDGNHNWELLAYGGASGGNVMHIQDVSNVNVWPVTNLTYMEYLVRFTQTGVHHLFVRGVAIPNPFPLGAADSFHVLLDGNLWATSNGQINTSLNWVAPGSVDILTAGLKTIRIVLREDGAAVDKVVIRKTNTTPTGTGPAESLKL